MTTEQIILFILKLLSGTGLFLVGVELLTSNIEQLATNRIKGLFNKTANNKLANVGIGAVTTAIIQSSGVTTVLVVGFVNIGIMSLGQATAMIMGANIGTTITAHLASLAQLDISTYIQIFAFIGVMMNIVSKKEMTKKVGMLLAGLALVFMGLEMMSSTMAAAETKAALQGILQTVKSPILLFIIGIVATALVQSSSATTSILITMSIAGLTIGTGGNEMCYIILGTNIGSTVTALLASLGAGTNAKRASIIHLLFNTFGSIIFFTVLLLCPDLMRVTLQKWLPGATATQIALFHTFFNVTCTAIFLPFSKMFVKLASFIIKDKHKQETFTYLDERILSSPSLAITNLEKEMVLMSDVAMDAFKNSYQAFVEKDLAKAEGTRKDIDKAAVIGHNITNYLVKASSIAGQNEEKQLVNVHNSLGDVIRISEIADNFIKYTRRTVKNNLEFSDTVINGLNDMVDRIVNLHQVVKDVVSSKNLNLIQEAELIEEQIDKSRKALIEDHIDRLNKGKCKPESSSVFINLVSNLERLGDHLMYIAYAA
ncbi:MAG: Na/Pi cotransporter family protein [Clostridia bacterium]|nr:Na/Pi cotransporter family protein [Clostridia bacterium]